MRHFLVTLLLAVLSIQFSWAAVGSYCAHDAATGAVSTGAHDPLLQSVDGLSVVDQHGQQQTEDDASVTGHKLDCGHCHGTCLVMMSLGPTRLGTASTAVMRPVFGDSYAAHSPPRPERPQWLAFA